MQYLPCHTCTVARAPGVGWALGRPSGFKLPRSRAATSDVQYLLRLPSSKHHGQFPRG